MPSFARNSRTQAARLAGKLGGAPERLLNEPAKMLYAYGILSRAELDLPDFLGIGAQKAGTTWLHRNLEAHPEIYVPRGKELQYFDNRFHKSLRTYTERFEEGRGMIRGEISPGYSALSRSRIAFVRRLLPDLRIVFLMRNPVDRAWSHALMNLVQTPGRAFESVPADEFRRHFVSPRSLALGDYRAILRNWRERFPPDRWFVGFFDDIGARPFELLRDFFRWLGVSDRVDWENFPVGERAFAGPGADLLPEHREFLSRMYRDDIRALNDEFGGPTDRWLASLS